MIIPLTLVSIVVVIGVFLYFAVQAERKDEKFDWKSAAVASIPFIVIFGFITGFMVHGISGI